METNVLTTNLTIIHIFMSLYYLINHHLGVLIYYGFVTNVTNLDKWIIYVLKKTIIYGHN